MAILDHWPSEGRIGQHTLTERRRKWGLNLITTNDSMKMNTKANSSPSEVNTNLQTPDKQGMPSRGSSHLAPTGIDKINHKAKPGDPGQVSIDRVIKLARLTGSAQYYATRTHSKNWNGSQNPLTPQSLLTIRRGRRHSLQAYRPRQLYLGSRRTPSPNLRVKV